MKKVLFIGLEWPEPSSSAAGIRILQLIDFFVGGGCEVHFATTAKKSEFSTSLNEKGVVEHKIKLNHSSFDEFISTLRPNIVVYDRFMIEEQFGWRVRQYLPNAIQILDTEDLHFLRTTRKQTKKYCPSLIELVNNPTTKREIASLLRVDLSLIISQQEMKLLTEDFYISPDLLHYIPFLESSISNNHANSLPLFQERKHFVFIGNFLHPPNWDAVLTLKKKIWSRLNKLLPSAELHIYGAYPTEKVFHLHNERERFFIKGRADNVHDTLKRYRVLLAPLNFGAGIKGKLLDATKAGLPYITTEIGIEGLQTKNNPVTISDFPSYAKEIYLNALAWQETTQKNREEFNHQFDKNQFLNPFDLTLKKIETNLDHHRAKNIVGTLLNSETFLRTKYMSLWIEAKNKEI